MLTAPIAIAFFARRSPVVQPREPARCAPISIGPASCRGFLHRAPSCPLAPNGAAQSRRNWHPNTFAKAKLCNLSYYSSIVHKSRTVAICCRSKPTVVKRSPFGMGLERSRHSNRWRKCGDSHRLRSAVRVWSCLRAQAARVPRACPCVSS